VLFDELPCLSCVSPSLTTKLAVPTFSSATTSLTKMLGVSSTVSSSTIDTVVEPCPMAALVAELRLNLKYSRPSTPEYSDSATRTTLVVSPIA
jgi:hypothetical protein